MRLRLFIYAALLGLSTNVFALGGPSQSNICLATELTDLKTCENGDVLAYKPDAWGSEQLPIIIAAMACDFNYHIVSNASGVSCIFTDKRKKDW